MDTPVLVAIVGLAGALVGSGVGGLISYFSTTAVRKLEWKQGLAQKELQACEDLYADFLSEASRLMLLSLTQDFKELSPTEFSKLATLEVKVWFHSDSLGATARELAKAVMGEFAKQAKTATTDEAERKKDEAKFANLRDRFVAECKIDLQHKRQENK